MNSQASLADLNPQQVRIAAYDPEWPDRYALERRSLERVVGEWAAGIHHVGSTAIPGVDAEPVIDILIGSADAAAPERCLGPLELLGYRIEPRKDSEAHTFRKADGAQHSLQVHLVPVGTARYAETLAFRDYLRADRQAAIGYAAMKRDIAERLAGDRRRYTAAKIEMIRSVLASIAD